MHKTPVIKGGVMLFFTHLLNELKMKSTKVCTIQLDLGEKGG